ncbi:MAG: EpsG family protein [Bacteroidales bacterium]|nr:EpsG family protein [Bacteroidales bacterium]
MTSFVYILFLLLSLGIFYFCGKNISKTGKIFSKYGIIIILVFTLNEGLRYGRGIDYNVYGIHFERYVNGESIDKNEFLYVWLVKFLIQFEIPFQGLIIIQSLIFIIALLYFLNNFKQILPYALPLFYLFTVYSFENLIRWFMGFSLILIGLSFLLKGNKKLFFSISLLSIFIHLGLLPIPFLFYLIYCYKKILFHPLVSIGGYLFFALLFKIDFMLNFTGVVNQLGYFISNETAAGYVENAEYWLSSGYSGILRSGLDSVRFIVFSSLLIILGYYFSKNNTNQNYLLVYNLYAIGFMFKPIGNVAEIFSRYDLVFLIFNGIICALIMTELRNKKLIQSIVLKTAFYFIFIISISYYFIDPFRYPNHYLYVWDNSSYKKMIMIWHDDSYIQSKSGSSSKSFFSDL